MSSLTKRRKSELLYILTHPGIGHGSGFSDAQIRINNLNLKIENLRADNETFVKWMDTIKSLSNKSERQPIEFYQFTEYHQEYYEEITVINYTDSAKAILRIFLL